MVSSKQTSLAITALLCALSTAGCAKDCGGRFGYSFVITNWKQAKPDLVQVYQYEADGKFDRLAAQEPLAYAAEIHVSETTKTQGLVLAPKDKALRHLSTSRDYKIVIDSRLEYRVYDVVSSNEPRWGCPIKSAKVNTCVAPSDSVIQFDADCR